MEFDNPWEDKAARKHKNKKAPKPIKTINKVNKTTDNPSDKRVLTELEQQWDYLSQLLEGSLHPFRYKVLS